MTKSKPAPIALSCYRQIVVLTGAGVSVASGLPTYRGIGGLWTTTSAETYASAAALASNPQGVWDFFAEMRATIASAMPNEAHRSLARASWILQPEQHLTVLTQNVDGLHTIAGSTDVVEVHGSLRRSRCTNCEYSRNEDLGVPSRRCPSCPECGALLRPDVVLFNEPLPVEAERQAKAVLRDCDLFIAVGTSGSVSPASNFVRSAEYAGARTVYVNIEPMTPPNPKFQEIYLGSAAQLLPQLLAIA